MPEKVNVTKIDREDDERQKVNRLSDIKPSINANDVEKQIAQPDFDIGKFGTDIQNKATRDSRSLFQEDLRNKDLGKTGKDLIEASQNVSKQLQENNDDSFLGKIKQAPRSLPSVGFSDFRCLIVCDPTLSPKFKAIVGPLPLCLTADFHETESKLITSDTPLLYGSIHEAYLHILWQT